MDDLSWLLDWYYKQCDGEREHMYGIAIHTLDNPGWYIEADLQETVLENIEFTQIKIDRTENDWIHCTVKMNVFGGYGGPFNLPEILSVFRKWVEETTSKKR